MCWIGLYFRGESNLWQVPLTPLFWALTVFGRAGKGATGQEESLVGSGASVGTQIPGALQGFCGPTTAQQI